MSIFWLNDKLVFPHHKYANDDGILALGGDLSVERLLLAYSNGIFPWYNEGEPIIWWSPHERFVLYPEAIKISRSLEKFMKKGSYNVTFDTVFEDVIHNCAVARQSVGTWITRDMFDAYVDLHKSGYAHSVEVWRAGELVGGLYGVAIGGIFAGESMFTILPNASKVALVELCSKIGEMGFKLVDCQVHTNHLESMGAVNILRDVFLKEIRDALKRDTIRGKWHFLNI